MTNENENVSSEITSEETNSANAVEFKTDNVKPQSTTPNRELTQAVLEKAIAIFKSENPDETWEEVDQETRWKYLDQAY